MKQQTSHTELTDPLSGSHFQLRPGTLLETCNGQTTQWPLSFCALQNDPPHRNYLRFVKGASQHVQLSPTRTTLVCKTDRVQEVELSQSVKHGSLCWQLYVPHSILFLTVGLKDKANQKEVIFDYSLKNSCVLSFKVDLHKNSFSTWINGVQSQTKVPQVLAQGQTWTPFVRLRQQGSSLALDGIIQDPEGNSSEHNLFALTGDIEEMDQDEAIDFEPTQDSKFESIELIDHNTLLLRSQQALKCFKRNPYSLRFNIGQAVQHCKRQEKDFYWLWFGHGEVTVLSLLADCLELPILKGLGKNGWMGKTSQSWLRWGKAIATHLNSHRNTSSFHEAGFQALNRKIEQLRPYLGTDLNLSRWGQRDSSLFAIADRYFNRSELSWCIGRSLSVNSSPGLKLSETPVAVNWTRNYLISTYENSKVSVHSHRNSFIRVGNFMLNKAIKKTVELCEYQKEADEAGDGELNKPTIYKILKNCLKYANKVKPPQKLVKELEEKREKMKAAKEVPTPSQPVKEEFVADKTIENTLLQMGFDPGMVRVALIKCKNASLEAAMDLIVNDEIKPEEIDYDKLFPEAKPEEAPKKEEVEEKPPVEEEIESQKIEEELLKVAAYETGCAIVPLVLAGVFASKVRLRLFCLNPRFHSLFSHKDNDCYINLLDGSSHQMIHHLTTEQLETTALQYMSHQELKDRKFNWIPIEDYDISVNEPVQTVSFTQAQVTQNSIVFTLNLQNGEAVTKKHFAIQTNKVYQEKVRSLDRFEQLVLSAPEEAEKPSSQIKEYNCNELAVRPQHSVSFTVRQSPKVISDFSPQTVEAELLSDVPPKRELLDLGVYRSSQLIEQYPSISYVSPWQSAFDKLNLVKTGVVLAHHQQPCLFRALHLSINQNTQISCYVYFTNHPDRKPIKVMRVLFAPQQKEYTIKVPNVTAKYVVVSMEADEKQLVEMAKFEAFGEVVLGEPEHHNDELKVPEGKLVVELEGEKEGKYEKITEYQAKTTLAGGRWDYSVYLTGQTIFGGQIPFDTVTKVSVSSSVASQYSRIRLVKAELEEFVSFKTDAVLIAGEAVQQVETLKEKLMITTLQYLETRQNTLLQEVLSPQYANLTSSVSIPSDSLEKYITEYLPTLPTDALTRKLTSTFLKAFNEPISNSQNLTSLIVSGLRHPKINHHGLNTLLSLASDTNSLNAESLLEQISASINRIAEYKSSHPEPYQPYFEDSIFSPYIHELLSKEKKEEGLGESIDKLHYQILLQKNKLSRKYTVDLLSQYEVNKINLHIQPTKKEHKMLAVVKWFNEHGTEVGSFNKFYDYQQCSHFVFGSHSSPRMLSLLVNRSICTRYLTIELHFTVDPIHAAKLEIDHLADADIIPIIYGTYRGESNFLQRYAVPEVRNNMKLTRRVAGFNRYATGEGQNYLFEEEDDKPEQKGDLTILRAKIELRESRESITRMLMSQPSTNNANYSYSMFARLTHLLLTRRPYLKSAPSEGLLCKIVENLINGQSGPIQQLAIKLLQFITQLFASLEKVILQCKFTSDAHIPNIFRHRNPLSSPQQRKQILKLLQSTQEHSHFVENCCKLVSSSESEATTTLEQIGAEIVRIEGKAAKFEGVVEVCNKLGWVKGSVEALNDLAKRSDSKETVRTLAQAAKDPSQLAEFLSLSLSGQSAPNSTTWVVLQELSKHKQGRNDDSILRLLLKWVSNVPKEKSLNLMERILRALDKLIGISEETVKILVQTLFSLRDRSSLLTQIMQITFFDNVNVRSIVINQALDETSKISQIVSQSVEVSFLASFLGHLLRHEAVVEELPSDIRLKATNTLPDFLMEYLNWGGSQGCNYLQPKQKSLLSIAYYLSLLATKREISQNLVKWYILNSSSPVEKAKEDNASGKFSIIHANVWHSIHESFSSSPSLSAEQVSQVALSIINQSDNTSNRFLAVRSRAKVYSFLKQLLNSKSEETNDTFETELLNKRKILETLLNQLQHISVFESQQNKVVIERQLANDLTLHKQSKPKDWLTYKNGAKNHVFTVDFTTSPSDPYKELTFESERPFWLTQLAISFECTSTDNKVSLAPEQILVKAGKSVHDLEHFGRLSLIPLSALANFPVNVYAINLIQETTFEECKIVRLYVKSPYFNSISDGSEGGSSSYKGQSLINFLSIRGFRAQGSSPAPDDVKDLVECTQAIADPKRKALLSQLFEEQSIVKMFEKTLLNVSYLMGHEQYSLPLHKFLMRVCELSCKVGDSMFQQYLQPKNSLLCSKLAAQIIVSNFAEAPRRMSKLFDFIITSIDQKEQEGSIEPFIEKFLRTISILRKSNEISPNSVQKISLTTNQDQVNALLKKAENSVTYRRLSRTLLSSPSPLEVSGVNRDESLTQLYQHASPNMSDLLACLVTVDQQSQQWFLGKDHLKNTFAELIEQIKEGTNLDAMASKLRFLTLLCQSGQLKRLISTAKYDLQIFEVLVGEKGQKMVSSQESKHVRQSLVEFIGRISLGSENEKVIGAMLKDSLSSASMVGSRQFVAEVFLPLLNSYSRTPLTVSLFSPAENKLVADLSALPNLQNEQKVKAKQGNKFILPSNILSSQKQQQHVFGGILGNTSHKWGKFKLSDNHGRFPAQRSLQNIRDNFIRGKQSFLVALKGQDHSMALYFDAKPDAMHSQSTLISNKHCFYIVWTENDHQIVTFGDQNSSVINILQVPSAEDATIAQERVQLLFKGQTVATIYFNGVDSCTFAPSVIKSGAADSQNIEAVEYWTLDTVSVASHESVFVNQQSLARRLLSQLEEIEFFRKDFKAESSLSLLKDEALYEFPTSITLREIKTALELVGCGVIEDKINDLSLKELSSGRSQDSLTLEELVKDKGGKSLILQLVVDIDSLLPALTSRKKNSKIEFLPHKGILKFFEENDGVQVMIKVIKTAISDWKNEVRREKWTQYVSELESFSAFPHFFSVYLKDKETFSLLLDLLQGLPDKEADGKWDVLESKSSQKLLKIVADILSADHNNEFRSHALKHDFMGTILERLRLMTGSYRRSYKQEIQKEEVVVSPSKQQEDDGTKKIEKKRGIGYTAETNSTTKWMKEDGMAAKKKEFENVQTILSIVESFLNSSNWQAPSSLVKQLLESSLLPYMEECLRAGTLLEISKHPEKIRAMLRMIKAMCKHAKLVSCMLPLPKNYVPTQTQSIQALLKILYKSCDIFLSCLGEKLSKDEKMSQQLAKQTIATYDILEEAILDHEDDDGGEEEEREITNILSLPLDRRYRELMKDLRFDYVDMKENEKKIKHHYSSNFNANYTPSHNKMIRLAQQLADISTALPHEHTNAIYVRCDKDRVDFMQALIMGSNGTPYGHGAFLFDIYFDDNYPNGPPKVNLTTTGHGKIRFNPNLYSCGKVCLSLLGTWRGSASENWDSKVSTLLQVLVSIQAIIMSEEVYFNEPGFEGEQGTTEGEKKNEAYSNIVRHGNIKFAMLENIKNPPKGFEAVIRRHFYLKKDEIMEECRKWQKYAEKRAANYVGLVNDHNSSWSSEFKKSKNQYKDMLDKVIKELEEELNKLPPPKHSDITSKKAAKKKVKAKNVSMKDLQSMSKKQEAIDVSYQIKEGPSEGKDIDIDDEKVKDRWSRYIGAMGIDAVKKQSKADILVIGLNPFGLEVVKNLVLSGCRRMTLCDDNKVQLEDLSGGFFYQKEDVGKKRVDSIFYKIRELNTYVKMDTLSQDQLIPDVLAKYTIIVATDLPYQQQIKIAELCREKKVKFVSAESKGAYCRLVNDFGEFSVLDKNGEEPVQVMLKEIECSEKGVVRLLQGAKHPFEDGEVIVIDRVEGMKNKQDASKSINGSVHKIKLIDFKSFEIGDTTGYQPYVRNGTAKNVKTPVEIKFRPFAASVDPKEEKVNFEENVEFYDFSKMENSPIVRNCFVVLDDFIFKHNRLPTPWNCDDATTFLKNYSTMFPGQIKEKQENFIKSFSFTCRGYLPPLCAFFGGLTAQEVIKGITQKYKPVDSALYLEFSEVIPTEEGEWNQEKADSVYKSEQTRQEGLAIVMGRNALEIIKDSRLFMIGAGAIGCELLKNFAMIGLGTGKQGKIILTDPDHIENSNLNRQFLFREKHISKPKSLTAAASVQLMNPLLKDKVSALLERVSDSTKDIFSNRFFESLTLVANALDNVAARRYVDQRCVENKVPLFESGTLGPKGHVQVIVPFQTESYGSQNDPVEDGEIPHCTLKLFPEQTLHCVEWARDIFGKKFSLQPKALLKFLEKEYKPEPDDIKSLNESLKMVSKGPINFEDCVRYATIKFYKYFRDDIMQLLYTYPLDAKTKNGEPFWRLPKRPPSPIMKLDPENPLHCTFLASMAVLIAKIYKVSYPPQFRIDKERVMIGKMAMSFEIPEFVPSAEKAKEIQKDTEEEEKKEKEKEKEKEEKQGMKEQEQKSETTVESTISNKNEQELLKELLTLAGADYNMVAEQFEKDEDGNGHIDFIYSMANLRANNYQLDPMDWITTKLKAGRIVPALATTTSCVAGLQTLEICKYLKKTKIDLMRNAYLNLAVPSLQMSEPGEVQKKTIVEGLTVTLWDRWEITCPESASFGEVYAQLKDKYGLHPQGVLQGMSRIDVGKGEAEKKKFLNSKVLDKVEREDDYADIVVLFTAKQQDDKILGDIPTVRLRFVKQ